MITTVTIWRPRIRFKQPAKHGTGNEVRNSVSLYQILASILFVSMSGFGNLINLAIAGAPGTQQKVKAHFDQGVHYVEIGLYDKAIIEVQNVLELQPESSEAFCLLGDVYQYKEMFNEAADAYQHALTLNGSKQTRGIANWCLGIIFNKQGKFLKAEKYGKEAVSLLPGASWAHHRLGDIYTQRGKLNEAVGAYQKAMQLNPERAEAYQGLGRIALMQNDPEAAIRYYQGAIPRAPYQEGAYYNLAKAYRRSHQLEKAKAQMERFKKIKAYQDTVQHYQKKLKKNPTNVGLHAELAKIHLEINNLNAAIREYHILTSIAPSLALGHYNLGALYIQQREVQRAIESFQKAIELDGNDTESYMRLGWIYASQKKFDLAKSYLQDALQRNPMLSEAYQGLGEIYAQQGILREAIAAYTKLTEIEPKAAEGWLRLGALQVKAKQFDDAVHAFQQAINMNPDLPDAYNNLAWLYADLNLNLDQAVPLAEKAVVLNLTASNLDTLAYAHYKNKNYTEAEQVIQRALEIDPNKDQYHQLLQEIQNARAMNTK
jgi:tetratricopeptide (TPR) repeat protein